MTGYIVCVGGLYGTEIDSVYSATVSSGGVGSWTLSSNTYPEIAVDNVPSDTQSGVAAQSCIAYPASGNQYIACVGGQVGGIESNAIFYAQVSSSGVGTWNPSGSYPTYIELQSCAYYSGYIYCVGGFNVFASSPYTTTAVYYAQVSSSGVGAWSSGSAYPTNINTQSCAVSSGYIYCVGGSTTYGGGPTNAVYYAQLSPTGGVGTWSATTIYSISTELHSCAASSGYIYCVGGFTGSAVTSAVYYGAATASGITSWSSTATYGSLDELSCASSSGGYIYCVGGSINTAGTGYQNVVKYALPSSSLTAPSAPTLSAATIFVNQGETVSGAVPSTGTAPYAWQWLVQVNGAGGYSNSALCNTNSGTGASASAPETCVIPTSTLTGGDTYNFELKATDATTATATSAASATLTVDPVASSVTVSCSPATVTAGSSTTCTATVTGSSPTGTVSWSSTSGTGIFTTSPCTLSLGSCSVSYQDSTSGPPVITASYSADANNGASSGTTILANFATPATAAESTPTSTDGGGGASVNQQGTTGITTIISGAPANTPVTVFSADLPGQPPGTATVSINAIGFYDVRISGITSGTANVCILNAGVTSSTVMQYYSGGLWVSATGVVDTVGVSICGNIPVSALNADPIVLGDPPATPQFPFSYGLAAVFLVSIVVYALIRGTVGVRRPVVSTGGM